METPPVEQIFPRDPSPTSWQLVVTISTRMVMVNNLATGTKFYFKVGPGGTASISPDSEIAETIAA